jgi:hypothetical protein
MTRTTSVAIALVLLFAAAASAAGPADTPPPSSGPSMRLTSQTGFAGTSETTISGMVVDKDGRPMVDVAAKLYIGGVLVSEILTSTDGGFELVELIDYANDVTIDMWFVPPGEDMVMENVILKESTTALQQGLYSKCVSRVRLDPITDFVVRILDLDSRTRMLKTSDCLG